MLDLIEVDGSSFVTASAVLKDKFVTRQRDATQHPLIVQGLLRDSYFGADGKLLYLVFKSFVVLAADGSRSKYLAGLDTIAAPTAAGTVDAVDQLLLEGDRVELVRFFRRPQAENLDQRLRASEAATSGRAQA